MAEQFISFEEAIKTNGSLIYTNVGVSMLPLIREGKDVIRIKKAESIKKYDVVLFTRPHIAGRGHYVLHRVLRVNQDGTYWVVGDHCTEGETVKPENIIGVLDTVIRNGKTVDNNTLSYRLYIALWCAPYPLRFFALRMLRFAKAAFYKLRTLFHRR